MVVYSINDIEKISGVKAHTLRIWEKRYGVIQPNRTESNIRYYLDNDLRQIMNIALLNKHGIKISKIAKMPEEDIKNKVAELSEVGGEFKHQLDSLTLSLFELDEYKFNRIVESNISQKGFETTMIEVIYPLLDKLGLMWITGSINGAHEKFVQNYIRQKLIANIDKLSLLKEEPSSFLIFLPDEEDHELTLLFAHYIIKRRGFKVINLGLNATLDNIKDACEIAKPNYIYTIINDGKTTIPIKEYVKQLFSIAPDRKILLSGLQIASINLEENPNAQFISSFSELINLLN